jgi:hypothetical protein
MTAAQQAKQDRFAKVGKKRGRPKKVKKEE